MILPAHPAARLAAVFCAMPEHSVGREETARALRTLFPGEDPEFIEQIIERSGVERRHIALSLEETLRPRDFTQRNACYREVAAELSSRAALGALERARLAPSAVDVLIDVSCTGITIPALDVDLSARLGLRPDVRRIPITESGCAAGALALGLAGSFAQCGQTTLIVAVELCSLTLCREDGSRTNIVSSVLFGDGAAAAVIVPDGVGVAALGVGDTRVEPARVESPGVESARVETARVETARVESNGARADDAPPARSSGPSLGPRLTVVGSHLFEGSREMMGFDVGTHGLRIVLQRDLPAMLARNLREAVLSFLARHDRDIADIGLHLVHPGGRRILDAYAELFGLGESDLYFSRESLRRYGNLSSASILTVLDLAFAAGARPADGLEGLVLGIGPGLSMELSLWSWDR
jgi:alkylresorcinol/alkylpyrone synthase